jgi:hypothetical protein
LLIGANSVAWVLTLMSAHEQHYSPAELGKLWGLSARFIRDLFRAEKGVLLIDRPEQMHKRGYSTIRIPASVAARVYSDFQAHATVRSAK